MELLNLYLQLKLKGTVGTLYMASRSMDSPLICATEGLVVSYKLDEGLIGKGIASIWLNRVQDVICRFGI